VHADDATGTLSGIRIGLRPMPSLDTNPVVIVEDDSSMQQALERILRLGGLRSITYGSAEALLKSDDVQNASCLILDVQLPGLTAFQLRDRLSVMGPMPPVIFITAFDDPEARACAARAAAAAFLVKPFSGRVLLETVRRALTSEET
jgi:FixJ family two-component response regulator